MLFPTKNSMTALHNTVYRTLVHLIPMKYSRYYLHFPDEEAEAFQTIKAEIIGVYANNCAFSA